MTVDVEFDGEGGYSCAFDPADQELAKEAPPARSKRYWPDGTLEQEPCLTGQSVESIAHE